MSGERTGHGGEWPFEALAAAKRKLDHTRIRVNRVISQWTIGRGSYEDVVRALDGYETELAAFRSLVDAHAHVKGVPRTSFGRFDKDGAIVGGG